MAAVVTTAQALLAAATTFEPVPAHAVLIALGTHSTTIAIRAADQAIELGRRPALFIGPDPITAVAAEAALEIGLVAGRRVGQIEIIIQHVQEGRPAGDGVGRPHIVGVIVVGDVKLLGLRPGRLAEDGRQQQGEDESKERAHLYPLHC